MARKHAINGSEDRMTPQHVEGEMTVEESSECKMWVGRDEQLVPLIMKDRLAGLEIGREQGDTQTARQTSMFIKSNTQP